MCNKTVKYPHVDFINSLLANKVISKDIYDKVTHKNAIKLLNL